MSEHERGAYTPPTDEPLSFDARQPVRGARPFPFTLVISALVLVGLAAAIFVFYRSGVRQAGQAPQTVGEPVGAITAAPPAEAQPTDPAAGLQIYSDDGATTPEPQFTPPPEQPQPRPAAPAVVVTPPAAAPTTPVTAGPALRPALPAAPAATPQPAPAAVKAAPTPTPKPAATTPAKPVAPATTSTAAPAAKTGGAAAVQIGAYSSQALAEKGLADAASIAGGGHGRSIERIQKDGATLFRTAVTGFSSRAEASAFCAKLKAAGKACFVR